MKKGNRLVLARETLLNLQQAGSSPGSEISTICGTVSTTSANVICLACRTYNSNLCKPTDPDPNP